jgi:tRNA U34 5-carboxymethylaminomethyl modifying GTPase MnmE/TrmE
MTNNPSISAEELDRIFDEGEGDIIEYLDLSTAHLPGEEKTMKILNKNNLKNIYEVDEHLWLEETIKILQEKRLNDLDIENLIEELESLSKKDKNRVSSFLEQIIRHLLLLQYWDMEKERNQNHWRAEIQGFRTQLIKYLTTNLQNYLVEELDNIYQDALGYVHEKTGFSVDFPEKCPYTFEQLLTQKWFPS